MAKVNRRARKLMTVDEFRLEARGGSRPDGIVLRLAVAEPEAATDGSRKVRFVFSDGTVDRMGDSINPNGWDIGNFLKNPVALWAHDSFSPPIGRASNVGPVGDKLMGTIEFMPAEISAFADSIYRMVKGGYLRGVSVGFVPREWSFVNESDRPYGIDFDKQELLEISVCPVPANPNALQEARNKGINVEPLMRWAERANDGRGPGVSARQLAALRKAAGGPATPKSTPASRVASARRHRLTAELLSAGFSLPEAEYYLKHLDPPGDCARSLLAPCGLNDPRECRVHGPRSRRQSSSGGAAREQRMAEARRIRKEIG